MSFSLYLNNSKKFISIKICEVCYRCVRECTIKSDTVGVRNLFVKAPSNSTVCFIVPTQ